MVTILVDATYVGDQFLTLTQMVDSLIQKINFYAQKRQFNINDDQMQIKQRIETRLKNFKKEESQVSGSFLNDYSAKKKSLDHYQ